MFPRFILLYNSTKIYSIRRLSVLHIVITGGGKVGSTLCQDLARENHDVVIIDIDPQVVERLIDIADVTGCVGSGTNAELLKSAGVPECDVFIAVTESDEVNIISSVIAHKLGAKEVITRVRNPDYSSQLPFLKENLGISMMINPEMEAAMAIAHIVRFPSAISIESFAGGRVHMVEVSVARGSRLDGMQLSEVRGVLGMVLVCIVQRGDEIYIPGGSFVLKGGDLIHITGPLSNLAEVCKAAGSFTKKTRSMIIIGGSRVARYLLRLTDRKNIEICVIEHDKAVAEALGAEFDDVKVIIGDGTDQSLLDEQHLDRYDCMIALTGIDEENLIASLYAYKKKVPKIITKVNRTQLLSVVDDFKLQTIITPKKIVSDNIIRFVRAMSATLDSKLEALYRILDDRVELLQFEVLSGSAVIGIPLKDLKIKKDLLIAYIVRGEKLIYPTGDDTIHTGDHVIAVTFEHDFDEVDDILENGARK